MLNKKRRSKRDTTTKYSSTSLSQRDGMQNMKAFTKCEEQVRRVLGALDVLVVRPLTQLGSLIEILGEFGGKERFLGGVIMVILIQ